MRFPTLRYWYDRKYRPRLKVSLNRRNTIDRAVRLFEEFAGSDVRLPAITEEVLIAFAELPHIGNKGIYTHGQRRELANCVRRVVRDWSPTALDKAFAGDAGVEPESPEGSLRRYVEDVYIPTELLSCSDWARRDVRRAVRRFDEHAKRFTTFADLTDAAAASFLQALLGEGYPATTVNKFRRNLFAMWRHAHRAGHAAKLPGVKKLRELREAPEAWTVDQFARMLKAAETLEDDGLYGETPKPLWWSAILNCAYWTGLRVGSILSIRVSDVDLRTGWLTVPAGNIKTRRAKRCRLHPSAIEAFERILSVSSLRREFVFTPHPVRTALRRPFDTILTRAGVPLSTRKGMNRFHKIRRTAATAAYEAGGINAAAALLDHSDTRVTYEHYIDGRAIRDNDATLILPVPQLKLA